MSRCYCSLFLFVIIIIAFEAFDQSANVVVLVVFDHVFKQSKAAFASKHGHVAPGLDGAGVDDAVQRPEMHRRGQVRFEHGEHGFEGGETQTYLSGDV